MERCIVKRYRIEDGSKIKPDRRGPWVEDAIDKAIMERNNFREALADIAAIPLSLPNSAAGIRRAQSVLDDASSFAKRLID